MSKLTLAITLFIVLLTGVMLWAADQVDRFAPPDDILPMTFAHIDHRGENCLVCHHNFQDDTGNDRCINCHQTDPEVNLLIRQQFHDLCMGCHMERTSQAEPSGPLRVCDSCHTSDSKP